jgi:glutamyl-tRNA synthetase
LQHDGTAKIKNNKENMTVITRFAPSPTGYLHIGGARTALFNYIFTKSMGGKFLLRIEDTDQKRSTQAAIDAILVGLKWLGLEWDGEPFYQMQRQERHKAVAQELLAKGAAYKCYCTAEELAAMRADAEKEGKQFRYPGIWRDRTDVPEGIAPSIRLKAPQEGEIVVKDLVQGEVRVAASELDDMVLLRSDGTPTYMHAVVVDDFDMGITHVIRGDDHFTNTFRQIALYNAMGWKVPEFAHIPLIHGADGAKMSKRHGAVGLEQYKELGYLPEALRNYLLRLGWGHGDDEIISDAQAIEWFKLADVGRAPSRFDFAKLDSINAHYIKQADNERLLELLGLQANDEQKARILRGMEGLKQRAKTLKELAIGAGIYIDRQPYDDKAKAALDENGIAVVADVLERLQVLDNWNKIDIMAVLKAYAEEKSLGFGKIGPAIRAATCGTLNAPDLGEVLEVLGKAEVVRRMGSL